MQDYKRLEKYALRLGLNVEKPKDMPYVFSYGSTSVWAIKGGWMYATKDLFSGKYTDHKPFDDLKEALDYLKGKWIN